MIRNNPQALRTGLILALSSALVVLVTWFAPALSAASLNLLFRLRGALPAPNDVVILAIDDQSLRRIGQWPWPRSVMATVLDRLTQARARSIGLDIIYAEPSNDREDRQLVAAIARNGRVVLPAQLYETAAAEGAAAGATTVAWLRPLPLFAAAASGIGHAHVAPGVDGMARSLQLSKTDDRAQRLWAFGLEVVRVAEGIAENDWTEGDGMLRFGAYTVPVTDESARAALPGVAVIRPNEMLINYAGPARSFQYYSIADLLAEKIPLTAFNNKLVLIGAVAQSMGDTRIVPFMHYSAGAAARAQQGGQEMPGVEIHANIIHSLRGHLTLRTLPDWLNFGLALLVMLSCALAVRWVDGWRQIGLLSLILLAIGAGSLLAFSRAQWVPPLAPMLTGFAAVIPLLLNRALAASAELDQKLAALVSSQRGFLTGTTTVETAYLEREQALALPQSLNWKLRAVDDLTTRLLTRMSFINRILSSMGESVLVADLRGRIVFANHEARQLFGCGEDEMMGAYFEEFLLARGQLEAAQLHEALGNVFSGQHVQLEFEIASAVPRHCSLLLSALTVGAQAALLAGPGTAPIAAQPASPSVPQARPPAHPGVVALFSDITRRVELDRMKTETLQLVSHELRTPLTSIQGLSDVLLKFSVAPDESRELIGTIHAESLRLSETINRYLDLTRLESGAQPLQLAPVDCRDLIGGCVRNLTVFAAERGITLRSEIKPDAPGMLADAQLLTLALNNLLSNAIKYSPPNTAVLVSAERAPQGLALTVKDQGFGIPAAARARIFEKFYRLERDANSNTVGTGLGLPLVKEIVEQHGGRITFESSEGYGSSFTLHLPASNGG